MTTVPIINVAALCDDGAPDANAVADVARQIAAACRESGFFYIVGHGVDESLQTRLDEVSRRFFALPEAVKQRIHMSRGGRAWRGFFPVGEELTSGRPDRKEGLYFGSELPPEDPRVRAETPLHGPNLFPAEPRELAQTVLSYIAALTRLSHHLMSGIALSLGLPPDYFAARYTADPLVLFRIFHYPPSPPEDDGWGVGEHTDYGILTILKQDGAGGLQVKSRSWVDAPPIPNSFVCNIGDMLERMTAGLYRSTPHRVRNLSGRSRLSFPFFFDPNFFAEVSPLPLDHVPLRSDGEDRNRWDGASVHDVSGTYGDYVLSKVGKVFPQLRQKVL